MYTYWGEWEKTTLAIKSILTQCRNSFLYIISIDLSPSINSHKHRSAQFSWLQPIFMWHCDSCCIFLSRQPIFSRSLVIYCHHLSIFIEFLRTIFIAIYEYWSLMFLFICGMYRNEKESKKVLCCHTVDEVGKVIIFFCYSEKK
jgi:hypothetical protein